jgi:hypothetical protein
LIQGKKLQQKVLVKVKLSITVALRSKARTVFTRSNAEIVGSNSTQGMDVFLRLFCVFVVSVCT